jgi:hypothetical protein
MVDSTRRPPDKRPRPGIPWLHTKTPISATECPPLTRNGHGTTPADHARPTRGVCIVGSEEARWLNRKVDVLDQLRNLLCHFCTSFVRYLSLGLIPGRVIEIAVKKALQKHGRADTQVWISGLKFGPIGSVRDRFRSTEPLQIFCLAAPSSVSRFGPGRSVDGSVGSVLGFLQVTDNMRILFV